ncbi:MAG: hypothetical protein IT489_01390 [Gammaproteobacteria bacterium]|nr:hypothetical protein [Gammaproteobacteria bacterium]
MRKSGLAALAAMAVSGGALAWNPPAVDYSADETMETAEFSIEGQVYASQGKERRETLMEGMRQIMILRPDKKLIWTLMPDQRMYIEVKPGTDKAGSGADPGDLSGYEIEQTTLGEEEVNGVMTTKSKIVMTGKTGAKMGGFWWTSKDGIVVKMDVLAMDKGDKTRIKKELRNLRVGPQDPALFEIPAGYARMDMMNMLMGGGGGEDAGAGETASGAEAPPAEEKKEKRGFGLKNIIDMVR